MTAVSQYSTGTGGPMTTRLRQFHQNQLTGVAVGRPLNLSRTSTSQSLFGSYRMMKQLVAQHGNQHQSKADIRVAPNPPLAEFSERLLPQQTESTTFISFISRYAAEQRSKQIKNEPSTSSVSLVHNSSNTIIRLDLRSVNLLASPAAVSRGRTPPA